MLSLFFFLLSSLMCVGIASNIKNHPVHVVDIIHNNIPMLNMTYFSDILVLSQTIFTVSLIDAKTLSEMFLIMGVVQLAKAFCSVSTVLPPLKKYEDKYRLGGINGSGTEYIFSGHASYSALTAIYLYKKDIVGWFPLFLYNLLSQFAIVATRNHYTVDIILAWIITSLVYGNLAFCLADENCSKNLTFFFS